MWNLKTSEQLIKFLIRAIESRNFGLLAGTQTLADIQIEKYIFQGDSNSITIYGFGFFVLMAYQPL